MLFNYYGDDLTTPNECLVQTLFICVLLIQRRHKQHIYTYTSIEQVLI